MEQKLLCNDSDNEMIKALSQALINCGIKGDSEYYYIDDSYSCPYFKLIIDAKSEEERGRKYGMYIDVEDNEYTVMGAYVHEHISSATKAAKLVKGRIDESIAEVAIIYGDVLAGFFCPNTGDPQSNVDVLAKDFNYIEKRIRTASGMLALGGHMHELYPKLSIFDFNLFTGPSKSYQLDGIIVYLVSSVFGLPKEYYVVK